MEEAAKGGGGGSQRRRYPMDFVRDRGDAEGVGDGGWGLKGLLVSGCGRLQGGDLSRRDAERKEDESPPVIVGEGNVTPRCWISFFGEDRKDLREKNEKIDELFACLENLLSSQ